MLGLPSLRLGKPFGIPLEVDASWLFIFFLVTASLVANYFPAALPGRGELTYLALGIGTAVAFFGSLVLHELAHSLVARAGGVNVTKVTLFMLGGVSQMEDEPRSAGHEMLLALAGPATSVLIGVMALVARAVLASAETNPVWLVPLQYLGLINLSLAAFNLVPGFPLDGGRVFRAIVWAITGDILKATRWATRTGQAAGMLMIAAAVFGVLRGSFDLVWLALIGWFLAATAGASYQQQVIKSALGTVTLGEIMSAPVVVAPGEASLEEMAHSYFLGGRHSRYPVVRDGHVIGLIDISHARAVPRERWPQTTAGDAASQTTVSIVVRPGATVQSVLPLLEPDGPGAVLVVDDESRLAGIVTRADVIALIQRLAGARS